MDETEQRGAWESLVLPLALILGLVLLLSLDPGPANAEPEQIGLLEYWLTVAVGYLSALAELAAAAVIGIAVVRTIWLFGRNFFSSPRGRVDRMMDIRLELGRALVLGLEFTVASDILQTAVAPSRQDIITLGATVLLRTLLNNLLEHELHSVESRREQLVQAAVSGEVGPTVPQAAPES